MPLYEDVNRGTIEIPQRTRVFKATHCLKLHNVPFKPASLISGKGVSFDTSELLQNSSSNWTH